VHIHEQRLAGFAGEERERFSSRESEPERANKAAQRKYFCLLKKQRVDIHSGMTQNIIQTSFIAIRRDATGGREGARRAVFGRGPFC